MKMVRCQFEFFMIGHSVLLGLFYFCAIEGTLIELDSSFLQKLDKGPWLVKFYAPWCGYCRRLEPVYQEVAQLMEASGIHVARLDATAYSDVASYFQVRGYPTIKYIDGPTVFTHHGDRTSQHIMQFAKRSAGTAVRPIPSIGRYKEISEEHKHEVYFVFFGPQNSALKQAYESAADSMRLKSFFYESESESVVPQELLPQLDLTSSIPGSLGSILVFKDGSSYTFKVDPNTEQRPLNETLLSWLGQERLLAFPQATEMDLWEMADTDKLVAIFVVNLTLSNKGENAASLRLKEIGLSLAMAPKSGIDSLTTRFQLVWMTDATAASNLAMTQLRPPNLMVFRPATQEFYLPDDYDGESGISMETGAAVTEFLQRVVDGKVTAYGGTGFIARLKRAGFDFISGLVEFVTASPMLAMLVIGVPVGVVSFLCYAICCMDTYDEAAERRARRRRLAEQNSIAGAGGAGHSPVDSEQQPRLRRMKSPVIEVPLLSGDEIKARQLAHRKAE